MKHANRPFLIALLFTLILVCGASASRPSKNRAVATPDCADQCKERYDIRMKSCNELSGEASEKCQNMAQKQYDSCLEKCKGGMSGRPSGL